MLITDFFKKIRNNKLTYIIENDLEYSFEEIELMSKGIAYKISKKIEKNSKALIFSNRNLNQILAIFSCQFSNVTFTIVDNKYNKILFDHIYNDYKPDIILADDTFKFKTKCEVLFLNNLNLNKNNNAKKKLINLGKKFKFHENNFTDIAHIIYTSGSTGFPKGIAVSHRMMYEAIISMADYVPLAKKDKILSISPFHFDFGYAHLLLALIFNCKFYLYSYSFPVDYINFINKNKITFIAAVPHQLETIGSLENYNSISVKNIMTTGSIMSSKCYHSLKRVFNNSKILNAYGITECFFSTYLPLEQEKLILKDCVGIPMKNVTIKIIKNNKECRSFEKGEIVHFGSHISEGYYNNYEMTKKIFKNDPLSKKNSHLNRCVFTGDMGYKDKKGYIFYIGRKDDIFKFNGIRTNTNQLQTLYQNTMKLKLPNVAVRKKGIHEEVYFFVVNKNKNNDSYREIIKKNINKSIKSSHRPTDVIIVDKIPSTGSGKIDKKELLKLWT